MWSDTIENILWLTEVSTSTKYGDGKWKNFVQIANQSHIYIYIYIYIRIW